eukprot:scaffold264918_cov21-Tisochrysis_lutea.AAC.2
METNIKKGYGNLASHSAAHAYQMCDCDCSKRPLVTADIAHMGRHGLHMHLSGVLCQAIYVYLLYKGAQISFPRGNTVLRTQLFWNIPLRNQGIASKKRQEQKKGSYLPKGRCIQGKRCAKGGQRFS